MGFDFGFGLPSGWGFGFGFGLPFGWALVLALVWTFDFDEAPIYLALIGALVWL